MKAPVKPKVKASKRPKKRYLLFELSARSHLSFPQAKNLVMRFLQENFGASFSEKLASFLLFDARLRLGIIRCRHLAAREIKSALEDSKKTRSMGFEARVVRMSGSIKKLKTVADRIEAKGHKSATQ